MKKPSIKQRGLLVYILGAICLLNFVASVAEPLEVAEKAKSKSFITRHHKLHMLFIDGTYLSSIKNKSAVLVKEISNKSFLERKAIESDNALAPCALLARALISVKLYSLQRRVVVERLFPTPIRGSNIFGMYDDAVVGGKFFEQSPQTQADILARMHIYWSGGFDTQTNGFIQKLTQQECLDHLLITDLGKLSEIVEKPSFFQSIPHVSIHYAPVGMHGSTYTTEEIIEYLTELKNPKSLELSPSATKNPTMPCSLVKGYMSAVSTLRLWEAIRAGKLFVPREDTPLLGEYREALKEGRIPTADPVLAAKITAGYFVNQTLYTDGINSRLLFQATQGECLDEFINPGTIQRRLQREGKM